MVSREFEEAVNSNYKLQESQFMVYREGVWILKKRKDASCIFLTDNNQCGVYEIRPCQCIMYPFELAFYELRKDGRLRRIRGRELFRKAANGVDFFTKGELGYNYLVPLLVHHSDCPGFTGDKIQLREYIDLAHALWQPSRQSDNLFATYGG